MLNKTTSRQDYLGDTSIEHGGSWLDVSTFHEGFVHQLEVYPMEERGIPSGCCWVTRYIVLTPEARKLKKALKDPNVREAFKSCGWYSDETGYSPEVLEDLQECTRPQWQLWIAEALAGYGHRDPDDYDSYPHAQVIATEKPCFKDETLPDGAIKLYTEAAVEKFFRKAITWPEMKATS